MLQRRPWHLPRPSAVRTAAEDGPSFVPPSLPPGTRTLRSSPIKLVCQTPQAKHAKRDGAVAELVTVPALMVPAKPSHVPSAVIEEIKPTSFYGKKSASSKVTLTQALSGPVQMRPLLSRQDRLKAAKVAQKSG